MSRTSSFDLPPATRAVMIVGTAAVLSLTAYALGRLALGIAPGREGIRSLALAVHLATVIPAMPLGLYVFLSKKGDARHRLLGKVWLGLMTATALASLFIRESNDGQFSLIHLLSAMTLIAVPRAIWTAKTGNIEAHRRTVTSLFLGAIVIAGLFTFVPGRLMWVWAFG
jgi:uncharacterized membrane protein